MNEGILPPQEQGADVLLVRRIGGRGRVYDMGSILNSFHYSTLNKWKECV